MNKFCRICAGQVIDENAWVDLDALGRFWLCPTHQVDATFLWTEDVGYVYLGANQRLVLGPYRYDPSRLISKRR